MADDTLYCGHETKMVRGHSGEGNHHYIEPFHNYAVVTLIDVVIAMRFVQLYVPAQHPHSVLR